MALSNQCQYKHVSWAYYMAVAWSSSDLEILLLVPSWNLGNDASTFGTKPCTSAQEKLSFLESTCALLDKTSNVTIPGLSSIFT